MVAVGLPVGIALFGIGIAGSADAADFTVTSLDDSGAGTLRSALESASVNPGDDRILFQSGLSGTIHVATSLPEVNGSVEILGPGPENLKIDGGGTNHLLDVEGVSTVSGLTLSNARNDIECYTYEDYYYGDDYEYCYAASGAALAVTNSGQVTVRDVDFTGNHGDETGGPAILGVGQSTNLTVEDSNFSGNQSDAVGAAILTQGGLKVTGSTFTGNSATYGGAIQTISYGEHAGAVTISGSTFTDNESHGPGGAVSHWSRGSLTIEDSTFTSNRAFWAGGAVMVPWGRDVKISGSTFNGNSVGRPTGSSSSESRGGAVSVTADRFVDIENSTFVGNQVTDGRGGAIHLGDGEATLDSLTVVDNSASGDVDRSGTGGIFEENWTSSLKNSIVSGNTGGSAPDIGGGKAYTDYYDNSIPAGALTTTFSLIGDTSGDAFKDGQLEQTNLIGVDPQLSALGDNGGLTQTMLPAPTSPVVDQGSTLLAVDQRGQARPVDYQKIDSPAVPNANGADMGAVELTNPPPRYDVKVNKVTFNKKKGTASALVTFSQDGKLVVSGKFVQRVKKQVLADKGVRVTIRPKGKALKQLKKKGKASVLAKFSLQSGKVTKSVKKTFKLVKKKKAGKRHPKKR